MNRLLLQFRLSKLKRERRKTYLDFAGSDVQNLDEFLRDYDLRIAELEAELNGN